VAAKAFWGVPLLLGRLPRAWALGLGERAGLASRWLARRSWRRAVGNVREIYGVERRQARLMARAVFRWMGRNGAELACRMETPRETMRWIDIEPEGLEAMRRANARGGVLLLVPHLGAFELTGLALVQSGFEILAPATPARNRALDDLLVARRAASGLRTLPRKESMAALVAHLGRGGVVGVLMDQDTRVASLDIDFLGCSARTPLGPALMARRTGAAVFCASSVLDDADRHQVLVTEVLPPGAAVGRSLEELSDLFNRAQGEHILRAPQQWVWFHRRWRFPSTGDLSAANARGAEHVAKGAAADGGGGSATGGRGEQHAVAGAGAGSAADDGRGGECAGGGQAPRPMVWGLLLLPLLLAPPLLLGACSDLDDEPRQPPPPGPTADQVVADFTLEESRAGHAQWVLRAEQARVYRDQHTDLDGVFLVFLHAADDTSTTIRADRGRYTERTKVLAALGNVLVVDDEGTEIRADSLNWDPQRELIFTEAAVEIRRDGDLLRGIGMEADPDLEEIVLKEQVSGEWSDLGGLGE
jgi:KDO2-lipid IV(A) lauroyltransferase